MTKLTKTFGIVDGKFVKLLQQQRNHASISWPVFVSIYMYCASVEKVCIYRARFKTRTRVTSCRRVLNMTVETELVIIGVGAV